MFQKICGSEKVLKKRGKEYQKFQSKVFLSHSAGKFGSGTTLLCRVSENFWQRESFEKEGEGVSKVSVENVLSHSAQKFGRGSLLCCVSEIFRYGKVLKKRGKEY